MTRIPDIKRELALSNSQLGSALAAFPAGALVVLFLVPLLVRRFGSRATLAGGMVSAGLVVAAIPLAHSQWSLAAFIFMLGTADAVMDYAQNTQGLWLQRLYGRSINNSLLGLWSVGAVAGAILGSTVLVLGVAVGLHLTLVAAIVITGASLICPLLMPGHEPSDVIEPRKYSLAPIVGTPKLSSFWWVVVGIGLVAVGGEFAEDAGNSWGALYLRGDLGATAATGGLALIVLQTGSTVGRFFADRLVDSLGRVRVTAISGATVAVGMSTALVGGSVSGALFGFALVGLGSAALIPIAMAAADEIPGRQPGFGLAAVSFVMRTGALCSPVLVGSVADRFGLPWALTVVVIAGLVVICLSRCVRSRVVLGPSPGAPSNRTSGAG